MDNHVITEQSLPWRNHTLHTWSILPQQPLRDAPVMVMLHGAGTADSSRAKGLALAFADCGVRVIALDFVGHGKSTGKLSDMSLKLRTDVAQSVIDHYTQPTDGLILCGFSMSGHTVLMLTERLGKRVTAISLMAPGVYTAEAENIPFTQEFSSIIRKENSWHNSLALKAAEKYKGKVHLLMSSHDDVIPWSLAEHLLRAFKKNAAEVRFDVLQEPDHKVAIWLSKRPIRGHEILYYLLGTHQDPKHLHSHTKNDNSIG